MPRNRPTEEHHTGVDDASELELHSPEELLYFADRMLKSGDENLMRAVVMESITALEAFVQKTVFAVLKGTMDPLLVKWMEEKTKMDFDSRLSVLAPVALGRPIDKASVLWNRYVEAKRIRNSVSHSGRRIPFEKAKRVYETAYEWLAYLGSTIEVDLAMLRFKSRVETGQSYIVDEATATAAVKSFFTSKKAAEVIVQPHLLESLRADLVLKYGSHTVIVETKYFRAADVLAEKRVIDALENTERMLSGSQFERAAVLLFTQQTLPHPWGGLRKLHEGRISTLGIQLPPTIDDAGPTCGS